MTKAEEQFQRDVRELGCIVCRLFKNVFTPCEIHHMLSGGRRMGEMFVLGLCYWHHRAGLNNKDCVSRGQNQRRFEAAYEKEATMLEKTKELVAALRARRVAA